MKPKLLHAWVSNRANDMRMMLLVYTAATIGTLFLIRDASSFGGEMQFAIAAAIVSFGVNAIVFRHLRLRFFCRLVASVLFDPAGRQWVI